MNFLQLMGVAVLPNGKDEDDEWAEDVIIYWDPETQEVIRGGRSTKKGFVIGHAPGWVEASVLVETLYENAELV